MYIKIGKRLETARAGRPMLEVCQAVGITVSSLCAYEAGQRVPRDSVKRKLSEYYGKPIAQLFFAL